MNRTLLATLACAALLPLGAIACSPAADVPAGDAAAGTVPEGSGAAVDAADAAVDNAAPVAPAMPVSQLCATDPTIPAISSGDFKELDGGLKYLDVVVGTGAEVQPGMMTAIHYAVFVEDGTRVDTSCTNGQPLPTDLTPGSLIDGWILGIPGMKVGGRRTLVVPGPLAYGEAGRPPAIGPNATLIFDLEVMDSQ